MNISIVLISKGEKDILRNLLEKYEYEWSQYDGRDVNDLGLYGYDYLDNYWTEENRFPYFVKVDGKLAGFVMVNDYPIENMKTKYSMSEFFILYKYRKMGVGTFVVNEILKKYKGKWGLMYHPKNIISKNFWHKVIKDFTDGWYELIKDNKDAYYEDGTIAEILLFET